MARSLVLLLMGIWAPDIFAQSESIPVSFTLAAPQPTCEVTKLQDINFGVLGRPAQGIDHGNNVDTYGSAYFDEQSEGDILRTLYGVTKEGGNPTIGKLKITAGHANTLTLTWDIPAKLVMGADHEIVYRQTFHVHSRNEDGPWDRISIHRILTLPHRGVEAAGTHYFRYGGEILISHDTEPGHYTSTITVTVSCPE